jgi:hypothetical protein
MTGFLWYDPRSTRRWIYGVPALRIVVVYEGREGQGVLPRMLQAAVV